MATISVIIPTIGRETLKNTLESVAVQTYKDFEVVVTDDTDEQKGKPIVEEVGSLHRWLKLKYITNTTYRKGPSGNKNNGLDHAEGDYITFIDDDDVFTPDALEKALHYIRKYDLDVLLANCRDNQTLKKTGLSYGVSEFLTYVDFVSGRYDGEYFIIARRELFQNERFFDDAWGAEITLWLSVFKKARKIFYLDEELKVYNSIPSNRVTDSMTKYPDRQMLNYYYILNLYSDDFKKYAKKQIIRYSAQGIYFSRLASDFRRSKWFLIRALKSGHPLSFLTIPWLLFVWFLPKRHVIFIRERMLSQIVPMLKRVCKS